MAGGQSHACAVKKCRDKRDVVSTPQNKNAKAIMKSPETTNTQNKVKSSET